ncbi:unnamed protein product [Discula destructiva]
MSSQPISQGMMGDWVKRIGKILGFENNTIAYSLRYRAGNMLDQNASESVRNLCLEHAPGSDTLQGHYLSRNVDIDVNAVHRETEQEKELLKKVTSHGSSRDAHRPIALTPAQTEALKLSDPEYVRLKAQLNTMPKLAQDRDLLAKRARQRLQKLRTNELVRVRQDHDRTQALAEIRQQALAKKAKQAGKRFRPAPVPAGRASRPTSGPQQRMLDELAAPLVPDLNAQFERRLTAVLAIMDYCNVEEPLSTKVLEARRPPPPSEVTSGLDPMAQAREYSASVHGEVKDMRRCYFCISVALTLSPDDPNLPERTRAFCEPASLSRHFVSRHLKSLKEDVQMMCPICIPVVLLTSKEHLQAHTEAVHGIRTDIKRRKRVPA